MNTYTLDTFLDHTTNPYVMPDFPEGTPAKREKERVKVIGDVVEAVDAHDVVRMRELLCVCAVQDRYGREAYPLMAKKIREALGL